MARAASCPTYRGRRHDPRAAPAPAHPEECAADADRAHLNQAKAAAHEAYIAANRVLGLLDETADPTWIARAEAIRENAWQLYTALAHETEW